MVGAPHHHFMRGPLPLPPPLPMPLHTIAPMKDLRLSVAMGQSSCSSLTTASVHKSRASHTWQISGFSQLPRNVHKPLSTSFTMDGVQWELRLFAYGENDDEQISLFLHYKHGQSQGNGTSQGQDGQVQAPSTSGHSSGSVSAHTSSSQGTPGDVTAKFQFKILSTTGQCDYVKGTNGRAFTFNAQKSAFGCPLLIHRTTLFNNPYLIHDDTLVLVTEIEMACNLQLTEGRFTNMSPTPSASSSRRATPTTEHMEQSLSSTAAMMTGCGGSQTSSPSMSRSSSASKHLEVLGMQMQHCISTRPDVYLLPMQSSDNQHHKQDGNDHADAIALDADVTARAVPAHRVILAARSAVFRAMFSASYAEAEYGTIQLTDVDHTTLSLLIHYIYTGQLLTPASEPLSWQQLCLLFEAAVRYDVELLTELCAHQLSLLLSRDTILQTLQLADTYKAVAGAQLLKQAAKTLFLVQFDDMIQAVATQQTQGMATSPRSSPAMAADLTNAGSMLVNSPAALPLSLVLAGDQKKRKL